MTQPLALLLYEKLMPGSQLVNRLQDLGYRVQTVMDPEQLVEEAARVQAMIVVADLFSRQDRVVPAITRLRQTPNTSHIPVIAFAVDVDAKRQDQVQAAGATLVVKEVAIEHHLSQLLDQALAIE